MFQISKQTIITISGKARHGKDTSAKIIKKILEEKGKRPLKINYADFLKYLAAQYLNWDGKKDAAGRTILQQLGNEKVHRFPTFWVDTAINIAKLFEDDYDYVIIADSRFPHDITRWIDEGYKIVPIHVERLNFDNGLTAAQKKHPSETALDNFNFAIKIRINTLRQLEAELRRKIMHLI